jgi:hypothetical protein
MPIHIDWNRVGLSVIPHDYRGLLVGFVIALGLAFTARFMRSGWLAGAAGGAGVAAGWYAISGRLWVSSPRASVDHLTIVAVVAVVIVVLCVLLGRNRGAPVSLILAAAFTGWWLCGTPRNQADLLQAWPVGLGVGVAVLLYARGLASNALDPLRLGLTGLMMAVSFHLVILPPAWFQLALMPALAALALFALPTTPALAALPIATDIAAVGSLAVIEYGRLPHLRAGPVDVAAVAPLLALWVAPRLTGRLRFAGRAATTSASVLAAMIAIGAVWIAMRVLGR